MVLNEITEKLKINACYHRTYLRMYRCQLKSFFSETVKIWKNMFSSPCIVIVKRSCSKSRSKSFQRWNYCRKKNYGSYGYGKCIKSYRELELKRTSVKMQVHGKPRHMDFFYCWSIFTNSMWACFHL